LHLSLWITAIIILTISLALSLLFPTPFVVLQIFVLLIFIGHITRRLIDTEQIKSSNNNNSSNSGAHDTRINYSCMLCGKTHNENNCPNCGSKMKKASFC